MELHDSCICFKKKKKGAKKQKVSLKGPICVKLLACISINGLPKFYQWNCKSAHQHTQFNTLFMAVPDISVETASTLFKVPVFPTNHTIAGHQCTSVLILQMAPV